MNAIAQMNRTKVIKAALWASLGYLAGKEKNRDALAGGTAVQVALRVSGLVDGEDVEENIAGELQVAEDSSRASSEGVDANHVLALALALVPRTKRLAFLRDLPEQFVKGGELPECDAGLFNECERMAKLLRSKTIATKKGDVVFKRV